MVTGAPRLTLIGEREPIVGTKPATEIVNVVEFVNQVPEAA